MEPGLRLLPPGVERYVVHGGGVTAVWLRAADRVSVIDPEGLQVCEVSMFDASGACRPELLDTRSVTQMTGTATALSRDTVDARRVTASLKVAGVAYTTAKGFRLFGPESTAGASEEFTALESGTCIVAAPGDLMRVDQQFPATDLTMFVYRSNIDPDLPARLPDPLAEPRIDLRIDRRTAQTYEVKAGEFIQIIDVEGRECSDFQCFDTRQLEHGIERCLDATNTRYIVGAAYPAPGLFAKFYDDEHDPVVEVIRDTCGRHDSFGVACTAKYYEDMGYPGHINCSDNFNEVLEPYGIAPRRGWMAMNLFYNTNIDGNNQLYFDEPWSRPGDYVLMRAMKDLVCVSSACPCDIDAANGWNPTDIHVRVYGEKNVFSKAIAFRMTTDAEPELTKETAFHPRTSQHTRNFAEYKGYWLPNSFTQHGAIEEYWACREGVIATDLSPLRKYEVVGPDAEALLQACVTRNIKRLSDGQVVYTAMCYDTGGMIDDGTVYRFGAEHFRWVGGVDTGGIWLREQAQKLGLHAWVKRSTGEICNLQVQGPKSRELLQKIVWSDDEQTPVGELGWFRFSCARLGGDNGPPLLVSRTGYTGELGFELFCHPDDALMLWDTLFEAGAAFDLKPLGLEALDTLRIEAGLVFADAEFCDQTDPFEAGIPFTVPLKTKEDEFIGKQALIGRKASPQRRLVGLELHGEEMAAPGDCVRVGRCQVGTVTSATRSPLLGKNVALCRMAVEYSDMGTEVHVGKLDGLQKRIAAHVVRFPFYDPDKTRVRS